MTPSHSNVSILTLARNHGAISFISELRKFITRWNETSVLASHCSNHLCITHVDVWYLLKFYVKQSSLSSMTHKTVHIAYANPEWKQSKKMPPAWFDTVLVNEGDAVNGTGIHGAYLKKHPPLFNSYQKAGKRVRQIWVIFKIPKCLILQTFGAGVNLPGALAYIEWFTRPCHKALANKMYPVLRVSMSAPMGDPDHTHRFTGFQNSNPDPGN